MSSRIVAFLRLMPASLLGGLLTAGLLGVMSVDRALHYRVPSDAGTYHERIRAAAEALPRQIDGWIGFDQPLPQAGVAMLHANVIVNRSFMDVQNGRQFTLLLVQCTDARDILGHYPPVCYPANGWTVTSARPRDWTAGDLSVPGMEYDVSRRLLERTAEMVIFNFMILPDGGFCRDMKGVSQAGQDYSKRFYGVAQIQLLFPPAFSAADRDRVAKRTIESCRGLIDEIRRGVLP